MTTRAKFMVTEKAETTYGFRILLSAVVGDTPDDKTFFKATPAGQITLQTVNEAASAGFTVGKKYYVDFTEEASLTA